jgi:hypothetical protein
VPIPVSGVAELSQGPDLYEFALNSPEFYVDTQGLSWWSIGLHAVIGDYFMDKITSTAENGLNNCQCSSCCEAKMAEGLAALQGGFAISGAISGCQPPPSSPCPTSPPPPPPGCSLADANVYRFSSKEWNDNAGLYYYLLSPTQKSIPDEAGQGRNYSCCTNSL